MLIPAFSLTPILVTKHFEGAAPQLALIQSAFGIGIVVGGLVLSAWGGFKRRVVTANLALVLMGISITTIGLTPATAFM